MPLSISIFIFLFVLFFFYDFLKRGKIGLLIFLVVTIFLFPFIHLIPYLWFDFNSDPYILWGLAVNPYMLDERVIKLTAQIGSTGALGVAVGTLFGASSSSQVSNQDLKFNFKTLPIITWLLWILVGVFLSYLSAPKDSIFVSQYASSEINVEINFNSSWLFSYIIFIYLFNDTSIETNKFYKKIKKYFYFISLSYVLIFLQLLRGDRESIPLIFGLLITHFHWGLKFKRYTDFSYKIPWFKIALSVFSLVFISSIVGILRSELVGLKDIYELSGILFSPENEIGLSNILHGTWSAVLLTPLSVAGDYINYLSSTLWGKDYFNILLSLPPGFIADLFEFKRPLDSLNGPAWEMRYGIGGTHALVLPFRNFLMAGVLFIPLIWSLIISKVEIWIVRNPTVNKLSLLPIILMVAPHWLWYGEKYLINALIIWVMFSFLYFLFTRLKIKQNQNLC
jgi:hypothetical protein